MPPVVKHERKHYPARHTKYALRYSYGGHSLHAAAEHHTAGSGSHSHANKIISSASTGRGTRSHSRIIHPSKRAAHVLTGVKANVQEVVVYNQFTCVPGQQNATQYLYDLNTFSQVVQALAAVALPYDLRNTGTPLTTAVGAAINTSPLTVSSQYQVSICSTKVEMMLMNNSNHQVTFKLYEVMSKIDHNYDPVTAWSDGLSETAMLYSSGGTAQSVVYQGRSLPATNQFTTDPGSIPSNSPKFSAHWKILKVTEYTMGTGDIHDHTCVYINPKLTTKLDFNASPSAQFAYKKNYSVTAFIVVMGVPGPSGTITGGVATGPVMLSGGAIDAMIRIKTVFKADIKQGPGPGLAEFYIRPSTASIVNVAEPNVTFGPQLNN